MDNLKITEQLEKLKKDASWEPDEDKRAKIISKLITIITEQ